MKKKYTVTLNSDRVHLSFEGTPVQTNLFVDYADKHQDGKEIAIGLVVVLAIEFNSGSVVVTDKSK